MLIENRHLQETNTNRKQSQAERKHKQEANTNRNQIQTKGKHKTKMKTNTNTKIQTERKLKLKGYTKKHKTQ